MRKVSIPPILCLALISASTVQGQGQNFINTYAGGGPDGGPADSANLWNPRGVAVDPAGNIYVGTGGPASRVFVVDTAGKIRIVAGSGVAAFNGDGGLARNGSINGSGRITLDGKGNLFLADYFNQRIRRVDAITNIITTYAGNGTEAFAGDGGLATSANLASPTSVAFARDRSGRLFVVDSGSQRIRVVTPGP